jgi:hypothetical protein
VENKDKRRQRLLDKMAASERRKSIRNLQSKSELHSYKKNAKNTIQNNPNKFFLLEDK